MTEEQWQGLEAMAERVDRLAARLDLVAETPSIAAGLQQLAEIEAEIAAGKERLSAIAEQEAALQQREVALETRERQLKVKQYEFEKRLEEATAQLRASYASLVASDNAMKMRILNYAGMLAGFNPTIQQLPDWSALERMLGVVDAITEMQDTPTVLTREGWVGEKFSEQTTLTRSVPTAEMASHDDLPTLPPPAVQNKRPSRRGYRAAMRRALETP
jgi:hypothetical protein